MFISVVRYNRLPSFPYHPNGPRQPLPLAWETFYCAYTVLIGHLVFHGSSVEASLSAGALYSHTAAKLVFIRLFRRSRHVYTHTPLGWSIWIALCFLAVAVAFVLAAAVPIFSDLIGITAALFAAWYTYGLAGFFWLHDTYHFKGRVAALKKRPLSTALAVLTILAGGFICVAGTYVSVKVP